MINYIVKYTGRPVPKTGLARFIEGAFFWNGTAEGCLWWETVHATLEADDRLHSVFHCPEGTPIPAHIPLMGLSHAQRIAEAFDRPTADVLWTLPRPPDIRGLELCLLRHVHVTMAPGFDLTALTPSMRRCLCEAYDLVVADIFFGDLAVLKPVTHAKGYTCWNYLWNP